MTSNFEILTHNDSDSDVSFNSTATNASTESRGGGKSYVLLEEYDNAKEAEKAVIESNIWAKTVRKYSSKNTLFPWTKQFYRCNGVTSRCKPQCCAGLYLQYHVDSQKVSSFGTFCEL